MGRPPIGKVAMTSRERVRRYRLKRRAEHVTKRVTKHAPDITALKTENAALKAEIAKLKAKLASRKGDDAAKHKANKKAKTRKAIRRPDQKRSS